jgi:hypothetical protein
MQEMYRETGSGACDEWRSAVYLSDNFFFCMFAFSGTLLTLFMMWVMAGCPTVKGDAEPDRPPEKPEAKPLLATEGTTMIARRRAVALIFGLLETSDTSAMDEVWSKAEVMEIRKELARIRMILDCYADDPHQSSFMMLSSGFRRRWGDGTK